MGAFEGPSVKQKRSPFHRGCIMLYSDMEDFIPVMPFEIEFITLSAFANKH